MEGFPISGAVGVGRSHAANQPVRSPKVVKFDFGATSAAADLGFPASYRSYRPAARHQLCVTMRTMTGSRMTTNSVGKMHTIIGTVSLAGSA